MLSTLFTQPPAETLALLVRHFSLEALVLILVLIEWACISLHPGQAHLESNVQMHPHPFTSGHSIIDPITGLPWKIETVSVNTVSALLRRKRELVS